MKQLIYIITSVAFIIQGLHGEAQTTAAINNYLQNIYRNHAMPGFSVVAVQKGKVVFLQGYGVESIGSPKPFTPQTVCAIGSLTKSITALAMMQLAEQGKVNLDKPVITYLPWFTTANKDVSDKITVRMLLNNTSGIYTGNTPQNQGSDTALEYFVRSLKSIYLTRQPGLSYQYSNAGFSVAGLIISKVSGMPYEQYVQQKIFAPLHMVHTTAAVPYLESIHAINGHYYGIARAIPSLYDGPIVSNGYTPAGSILSSTAEDMGKYLLALMNGSDIISNASINEMWKQSTSFPGLSKDDGGDGSSFGYGLGWMISNVEGDRVIHHGGSTGKMSSFTMIDVKNQTAVCLLANIDLSFIDKYRYATEFTIVNNIRRLALGLPPSNYGAPTVKDPTLNTYDLNNKLAARYAGSYTLKNSNVNFLYEGASLRIEAQAAGAKGIIYRGKQVLNKFALDFANEAFAVSRNDAMPVGIRFKLTPDKKVAGLFFGDMEFLREEQAARQGQASVLNGISFNLPAGWKVNRQPAMAAAQSPNGDMQLTCVVTANADSVFTRMLNSAQAAINTQLAQTGLTHTEKTGALQWKETAYACGMGTTLRYIITASAMAGSKAILLMFVCRPGIFTQGIQAVLNPVLHSIRG